MADIDIVEQEISIDESIESVRDNSCGAIVVFIGTVRNEEEGKRVKKLEYEAYDEMAKRRMEEIVNSARKRWGLKKVRLVHRKGVLKPGEVSVLVAVSSPHRKEAFEACRFIIDSVKREVPIWKKERFADKTERWVVTDLR